MSKSKKQVSETLDNNAPVINETLKSENMAENASEMLVENQETANEQKSEEVVKTNEELLNELTDQLIDAKTVLNSLESEMLKKRLTKSEDVTKQTLIVNDINKKILALEKTIANDKLKADLEEKTVNAKQVLADELAYTQGIIDELLADTPEAKKRLDSLKWAFNFIFGKQPVKVADDATSKDLTKTSEKSNTSANGVSEKFNMSAEVKSLLNSGLDDDGVYEVLRPNTNITLDDKTLRKRITDIRWGWEKAKGLR